MSVELDRHSDSDEDVTGLVVEVLGLPWPKNVRAIVSCLLEQLEGAVLCGVVSGVDCEGGGGTPQPLHSTHQDSVVAVRVKFHLQTRGCISCHRCHWTWEYTGCVKSWEKEQVF